MRFLYLYYCIILSHYRSLFLFFFFFKQKTAYELGLGIPAEPLFRSNLGNLLLLGMIGVFHNRRNASSRLLLLRCLLINRRSLLLALRLLWKTPIFPSNSRFPRLCAKCLLKLKRLDRKSVVEGTSVEV